MATEEEKEYWRQVGRQQHAERLARDQAEAEQAEQARLEKEARDKEAQRAGQREAYARKMAEWFRDRKWRIATDVSRDTPEMVVREGEFWTKPNPATGEDRVYQSPLGHKGRHGYILQEVDLKTGLDVWRPVERDGRMHREPSRVPVGWMLIKSASEMFPGCIDQVPPRPYGHRGGVAALLEKKVGMRGRESPGGR